MILNFVSTSFKYSEVNYCKLLQTYCNIMQSNMTQQTAASLLNLYFFDSVSNNNDALKYLLQDYWLDFNVCEVEFWSSCESSLSLQFS